MSGKDMELTGIAAATSHLHDMENSKHSASSRVASWDADAPQELMDMLTGSPPLSASVPSIQRKVTINGEHSDVDLDSTGPIELNAAEQFKATFEEVKAELATGNWLSPERSRSPSGHRPRCSSPQSMLSDIINPRNSGLKPPSTRGQSMKSKVHDLDLTISAAQSLLDADLRFVRNIATLTPFQQTTRSRLRIAVQNASRSIMQARLDLIKIRCQREVLADDLAAELRERRQAKKLALKAAAETLQGHHAAPVPTMTLSFHDDGYSTPFPLTPSPQGQATSLRTGSSLSLSDSFHSALDYGPDWSEGSPASEFLSTAPVYDSPSAGTSGSFTSFAFPTSDEIAAASTRPSSAGRETPPLSASTSGIHLNDSVSQVKLSSAESVAEEEAEEWNRTRCAHRVSLVRMPSDNKLPEFFRQQQSRFSNGHNTVVEVAATPTS